MDADVLIVFMQYFLKLMYVQHLLIMEHRNIVPDYNLIIAAQLGMRKHVGIGLFLHPRPVASICDEWGFIIASARPQYPNDNTKL